MNDAIKINNLVKIYHGEKREALNIKNLSVKKGKIFGILGPNGAGKTTLISILCKVLKPSSGDGHLFGSSIFDDSLELKKIVGLVPQSIALYNSLTAKENLEFFGAMQKISKNILVKRIEKYLNMVGLEEFSNKLVSQFSGGMKRRLNIAVGLIHEPSILFLDEPTVGIDPQSRNLIFENILELKKSGMTIIYTTHYMEEIPKICDEVLILDNGITLEIDSPFNLLRKFSSKKIIIEYKSNSNELKKMIIPYDDFSKTLEEVMGIIKNKNMHVVNLYTLRESMEDVFLKLTGKQLRD
ncbi:hypothetical protein BVX93_01355 [bacterium B13(2017)]|nr:hypothetical protein BVX93_01355 [bacterium B13(2017)]